MAQVVFIGYMYSEPSGYQKLGAEIPVVFIESVHIDPEMRGWENFAGHYDYWIDAVKEIDMPWQFAANAPKGVFVVHNGEIGYSQGFAPIKWDKEFPNPIIEQIVNGSGE